MRPAGCGAGSSGVDISFLTHSESIDGLSRDTARPDPREKCGDKAAGGGGAGPAGGAATAGQPAGAEGGQDCETAGPALTDRHPRHEATGKSIPSIA